MQQEKAPSRRKVCKTIVSAAGLSTVSGLTSAEGGTADGLVELFEEWTQKYGSLVDITTQETGTGLVQQLEYQDGTVKTIVVVEKEGYLLFKVQGKTYTVERGSGRVGTSNELEAPLGGGGSVNTTLSAGDSTTFYSADNYRLRDLGGSIGTKTQYVETDNFESHAAVDAAVLGYRTILTDAYVDFEVSSGNQIEAVYDYDFGWQNSAAGDASSTVAGKVIIRDLDRNENLSIEELFSNSGSYIELKGDTQTGQKLTSALLNGSGTYRLGVRAKAKVDVYGAGNATANVSSSGTQDGSVELSNIQVSIE